jgi:hypothetical protein
LQQCGADWRNKLREGLGGAGGVARGRRGGVAVQVGGGEGGLATWISAGGSGQRAFTRQQGLLGAAWLRFGGAGDSRSVWWRLLRARRERAGAPRSGGWPGNARAKRAKCAAARGGGAAAWARWRGRRRAGASARALSAGAMARARWRWRGRGRGRGRSRICCILTWLGD